MDEQPQNHIADASKMVSEREKFEAWLRYAPYSCEASSLCAMWMFSAWQAAKEQAAQEQKAAKLAIEARPDEISRLKDGWHDGDGSAISSASVESMRKFTVMVAQNPATPVPHLYPTHEGGVTAEWSIGAWELSAEIGIVGDSIELLAVKCSAGEDERKRIADLERELAEKDKRIAEFDAAMHEYFDASEGEPLERGIGGLAQEMWLHGHRLFELRNALVDKDRRIAELERELADNDLKISDLDNALQAETKNSKRMSVLIDERDAAIAEIKRTGFAPDGYWIAPWGPTDAIRSSSYGLACIGPSQTGAIFIAMRDACLAEKKS